MYNLALLEVTWPNGFTEDRLCPSAEFLSPWVTSPMALALTGNSIGSEWVMLNDGSNSMIIWGLGHAEENLLVKRLYCMKSTPLGPALRYLRVSLSEL